MGQQQKTQAWINVFPEQFCACIDRLGDVPRKSTRNSNINTRHYSVAHMGVINPHTQITLSRLKGTARPEPQP